MAIQFCTIRRKVDGKFMTHKEEVWGVGSTMTGEMTHTVFEFVDIRAVYGVYSTDRLTMFENHEAAKNWIEKGWNRPKDASLETYEIVTFADLDAIVEKHLLDVDE